MQGVGRYIEDLSQRVYTDEVLEHCQGSQACPKKLALTL